MDVLHIDHSVSVQILRSLSGTDVAVRINGVLHGPTPPDPQRLRPFWEGKLRPEAGKLVSPKDVLCVVEVQKADGVHYEVQAMGRRLGEVTLSGLLARAAAQGALEGRRAFAQQLSSWVGTLRQEGLNAVCDVLLQMHDELKALEQLGT